jgi:transposase
MHGLMREGRRKPVLYSTRVRTWRGRASRATSARKRATKLAPFEAYLRERQAAAHPHWIPATVLMREIARWATGVVSQLRAFMHAHEAAAPLEPVVRFETAPGEQMQVDWVEFRKGAIRCMPSARPWATAGRVTSNSSPT